MKKEKMHSFILPTLSVLNLTCHLLFHPNGQFLLKDKEVPLVLQQGLAPLVGSFCNKLSTIKRHCCLWVHPALLNASGETQSQQLLPNQAGRWARGVPFITKA